jgi:hypothetical protein
MGRSSSFRCATCKKIYYLGYTSYSSWVDFVKNEKEFENKSKKLSLKKGYDVSTLTCNKNVLECLKEHKNHNFIFITEDWKCSDYIKNLPEDWEDYPESFEQIDMEAHENRSN